jgi:hypothetical protein
MVIHPKLHPPIKKKEVEERRGREGERWEERQRRR